MITKTKAIQFSAPFTVDLVTLDLAPLGANEVRCKAMYSLISVGTEAIQYARNSDASMHRNWLDKGTTPYTPSYNMTAEIIEVGSDVKDYKVGDIVYALVGHCQYFNIDQRFITKKPDWMDSMDIAWFTVLRTGMFALIEADLRPWKSVCIAGLGVFGISTLEFAKVFNARNIVVVEPDPWRAEKAKSLGATHVIYDEIGNVTEKCIELNGGELFDVCVDATAWCGNIKHLQYIAKRGGHISVIADPPNTDSQLLNWGYMHYRGQHVHGVYIDMIIDEGDPMHKQREVFNPFYPLTMQSVHEYMIYLFQKGELRVHDLISGTFDPRDCKAVYKEIWDNRSKHLGAEFDWTGMD